MMKLLVGWIQRRQRKAIGGDEWLRDIDTRTRALKKSVHDTSRQQMQMSKINEVNPVYDRIKGRPQ